MQGFESLQGRFVVGLLEVYSPGLLVSPFVVARLPKPAKAIGWGCPIAVCLSGAGNDKKRMA